MSRLWTLLTCNWFVIALECRLRGHNYTYENLVVVPQHKYVPTGPGVLERRLTGKREIVRVFTCNRCGNYRGMNRKELDT
jgi:hypothetical protein